MQTKWRVLRKLLTTALAPALASTAIAGSVGTATASPSVEYLMIPSAAMGRDIPVAFQTAAAMPFTCWTPSMPPQTSAAGCEPVTP